MLFRSSDFNPATDLLAPEAWLEIDRYAVALAAGLQKDILADYDRYEFHPAVARLQTFCSEDLGAFYLDILKDRLYTTGRSSSARRSAQSALWHITQSLLRLMAPVLSFTADEAWQVFDGKKAGEDNVFLTRFYELPAIADGDALLDKWSKLRAIRAEVTKLLETHREAGRIGSSLQAEVEIRASGERLALQIGRAHV